MFIIMNLHCPLLDTFSTFADVDRISPVSKAYHFDPSVPTEIAFLNLLKKIKMGQTMRWCTIAFGQAETPFFYLIP